MKTLFLHVGMHKTGSTSIQAALNRDRESLAAQGVYVPLTATEGNTRAHQNIAWELVRDVRYARARGSLADLHEELTREKPEKAIISSEGFTSLDTRPGPKRDRQLREFAEGASSKPNRYNRLREFADSLGYSIVTVGFVRDYASCLNSAYTQQVKTFKHGHSFAEYVLAQRSNDRWHYDIVFAGWEAISKEVICKPNGQDNVRALYEILGAEHAAADDAPRRNSGVGPKTIECSRILFRQLELLAHRGVGKRRRHNKTKEKVTPHNQVRKMAQLYNWNDELFWGFDADTARDIQNEFLHRDGAFLARHKIVFGDSYQQKRNNDFILERASEEERLQMQSALAEISKNLDIAE